MKGNFDFVAERALARHSPALMRPGPAEAEVLAALGAASARLVRTLPGALSRLCGVELLKVGIAPPQDMTLADFASENLCSYSLYSASTVGERLLSAIDAEAVLRLVDRAFGGPGDVPRPMPRELPMSADMMLARIETILAAQLGAALGSTTGGRPVILPLRRETDLAQLQPFARDTRVAMIEIAVADGARAPWPIRFALPMTALPMLTGMAGLPAGTRAPGPASDPAREPFAAMPLRLTALLVDTRVPLHVVTRLEPGQVLNLPIARAVPLIAGRQGKGQTVGHAIGHGTIGAMDDRVAIQMTQLT
ncbi:FliM/FliN family flagellar motor switch protein [Novosphingobium sp.]|uniref:FliM/FliN family flagellar motor switch protein n=1 Tax=Novosphingobium sp. TaxID=1874826 RepID=UPI003B51C2DC